MRSLVGHERPAVSIVRLAVLGSVMAVAVACSGSAAATAPAGEAAAPPQPAASAGSAAGGGSGTGSRPDSGAGSGAGSGGGTPADGGQTAAIDDTKIVRTGSLQITVQDTDRALIAGRDAVRAVGGYIGAAEQQRKGDQIVATVTYRVPVVRWEEALDAIRALGTEQGEQIQAVEVTGQIVDLDARIRNLKASEAALVGYAAKAPKISDLLEVEARLTSTRGEIERLTSEQAALSDRAAMATLTVTFGTEVVAVSEAAARWDPAAEVDRSAATLIGLGQGVVSFLIVFAIVWLPILLGIGIVAAVALAVARRLGWRGPRGLPPIGPVGPTASSPTAEG